MTNIYEIYSTVISWCQISFLETLYLGPSGVRAQNYDAFVGAQNDVFSMNTDLHEINIMGFFRS